MADSQRIGGNEVRFTKEIVIEKMLVGAVAQLGERFVRNE